MMKQTVLPVAEIATIAATRVVSGIGAGLLFSLCLKRRQRRSIGLALLTVGAVSTPPLIYDLYCRRIVGKR